MGFRIQPDEFSEYGPFLHKGHDEGKDRGAHLLTSCQRKRKIASGKPGERSSRT
jgi:hypothetical protein